MTGRIEQRNLKKASSWGTEGSCLWRSMGGCAARMAGSGRWGG